MGIKEQKHIILEQYIELLISQKKEAWPIQQEVSHIFWQHLLPFLDRYLNELSDPDTLLRLDTVEINLGELDPSRLSLDLEEKLRRRLKPALMEAIQRNIGNSKTYQEEQKVTSQLALL